MTTSPETGRQPISSTTERLASFQKDYHFYPANNGELTDAMGLLDYLDKPGGTAKFLNIILQSKEETQTDDPRRAVWAVTQRYVDYFKLARVSLTHLEMLDEEVREIDKPTLNLEEATGSNVGFAELAHFIDLRCLARDEAIADGGIDPLDSEYLIEPTPQVKAHITETARRLHVKELHGIIPLSVTDQRERARFWRDRLVECQRLALAKPIARAALQLIRGNTAEPH
jgi:hypothetical protein